ncbi:uncharacterized protein LOC131664626 [Phymastichus coffea]|uniref:uncharacterized protein LOC131664626 n=1 Tax=Phymastichus coffea TaxID=108790 RepID=UPI00273AE929|nr:uncharacterized protein LOC131664626 [Phymastichus coffea]
MSQIENVDDLQIEIQKLLAEINKNMNKLKNEVESLHNILEKDASLPVSAKMVNEVLMVAAKEAGIDLADVQVESSDEEICEQNVPEHNASEQNASEYNASEEDESNRENVMQESRSEEATVSTNATSVAAAADKLTKKVKRTLR